MTGPALYRAPDGILWEALLVGYGGWYHLFRKSPAEGCYSPKLTAMSRTLPGKSSCSA
jgi:hypothetical protein